MRKAPCDLPARRLVSVIALVWAALPAVAAAQAETVAAETAPDAPVAEAPASPSGPIVVTGTRIASGFDAPTPVSVLGADRLAERGAGNIGDALNELPAFRSTQRSEEHTSELQSH